MLVSFWRLEIVTQTLRPSTECRALHGLPSDAAFSYAHYLAAIHPDDREEHRHALQQAITETGHFDDTYRVIWPDGSVHRIRALGSVGPALGCPLEIDGASSEVPESEMLYEPSPPRAMIGASA